MTEIVARGPLFELAALMLNNDFARAKADEETMVAAHHERMQALDDQARSLHEAADATRLGAFIGASVGLVGAGLAMSAHVATPEGSPPSGAAGARLKAGDALAGIAPMAERCVGTAPAEDANADATQAEKRAGDAESRADEARRHHARVSDNEDRTLATLQSTLDSEAQGNLAIIANV
jgi:hypothetical protein